MMASGMASRAPPSTDQQTEFGLDGSTMWPGRADSAGSPTHHHASLCKHRCCSPALNTPIASGAFAPEHCSNASEWLHCALFIRSHCTEIHLALAFL